ncbi:hypothetical protein SAMN05421820_103438 [Pedobacter steynii]|uniref:Uncharacterized protein n=1 Tax=Pedobacter steynii TaxID=430522 RepID=A0A1G9S2G2_9SPHI|nr:hypothetical protein SAMN05421820_103438 [Pedobacter steynii]
MLNYYFLILHGPMKPSLSYRSPNEMNIKDHDSFITIKKQIYSDENQENRSILR